MTPYAEPNTSHAGTSHSIHIVTMEVGETGCPVYHYIAFRDHTNADKVLMFGLAIPRKTSDIRALRGVMAPPQDGGGLSTAHFTKILETEIFRGSVHAYLEKMAAAVKALHFINAQNLNARIEDINSDSPNSIARTLVEAMQLDYPEHLLHFWAPGHERILLPHNWSAGHAH